MIVQKKHNQRKGFAIMEAILAVAVCGVMATGIVVSMQRIANLSFEAKRQSALTRIIHNELMFTATNPLIQEGKSTKLVEEWDVEIETIVSPLEGLVTEDGTTLEDLYVIVVNAVWWADGGYEKQSVETWRNKDMYVR